MRTFDEIITTNFNEAVNRENFKTMGDNILFKVKIN